MPADYWQRDGIEARLRIESSINQPKAAIMREAAAEIERLRLTETERDAIEVAVWEYENWVDGKHCKPYAEALRGLLRRHS